MNEQEPQSGSVNPTNPRQVDGTIGEFHDIVQSSADEHASAAGINVGSNSYQDGQLTARDRKNGTRLKVAATSFGMDDGGIFVQAYETPENVLGRSRPIDMAEGPVHTLGYSKKGDRVSSDASVKVSSGDYRAAVSSDGEMTYVNREGYGNVILKNPRAKVLIARLAAKAMGDTVADIKEIKRAA